MNDGKLVREEQGLIGFSTEYAKQSNIITESFANCRRQITSLIENGFLEGSSTELLNECMKKIDQVIAKVNDVNGWLQKDLAEIREQTKSTEKATQDALGSLLSIDPTKFQW